MTASQHPDIIFKGIDGNECEEFIAALEDLAYTEGWADDRQRMLFLARSRLRKAALRWFARLEPSVKSDWDLFVQALFDQYPPVAEPLSNLQVVEIATPIWSTTTLSPVPSTATLPVSSRRVSSVTEDLQRPRTEQAQANVVLSPNEANLNSTQISPTNSFRSYEASLPGLQVGRLRIAYEDGMPPAYVWNGTAPEGVFPKIIDGVKCVTLDPQAALIVCFRTDTEAHSIACLDTNQKLRDLAVHLEPIHCEFHPLVATTGVHTARQVSFNSGGWSPAYQVVSKIWNVLEDGTLQATLSDFTEPATRNWEGHLSGSSEPSNWTTTTAYVDTAVVPISFTKDFVTPNSVHPYTGRPLLKARLVFEPCWLPEPDTETPSI